MAVEELLERLRAQDVKLRLEGGQLRCSAPPGVLSESMREEISRRKPDIMAFLAAVGESGRSLPRLRPAPRNEALCLSYGQQRFWFLQQLEPESPAYNISAVIEHRGPLRVDVVERCLRQILRRHECLRARFPAQDGQPTVEIGELGTVAVSLVDLTNYPESEREAEAQRLRQAEAETPFDLAAGPMWRAKLLRLEPESHVFIFTIHHILCDWWSIGIFFREFAILEASYLAGRESPLPDLPLQYADYAHWQRRWLEGDALAGQLAYWRKQLGGELPALALPTDRPRQRLQSHRSSVVLTQIPERVVAGLQTLARSEGATLYMTLLASLSVMLGRYAGQTDILIGTPIANRNHVETERLIGFFINTLVMRSDLSGNPTFRELLVRVREMAMGAYANQDVPFEKLVHELQPERDLSRTPMFQVMFVLHNVPRAVSTEGSVDLAFTATGASMFDLSVELRPTQDGLAGGFDYNADLFEAETMERMVGHFGRLLESVVADPQCRIGSLRMAGEDEEARLLGDWSGAGAAAGGGAGVWLDLYERRVAQHAQTVAVECEGRQVSYGELDRLANQLGWELRAQGVGRGAPVLVCLERGVEAVAAMLGIWKAGGVYVPMDSDAPLERQRYLAEDSGARVVIGQESTLGAAWTQGLREIRVDAGQSVWEREGSRLSDGGIGAGDSAYVIYTSGSTGVPKGVEVAHEELRGHMEAVCEAYELSAADSVLQFSSLSFDASLEQVLGALSVGGRLVLRGAALWEPEEFGRRIVEAEVTVADLPTAYWHEVARQSAGKREERRTPLRLVIVGGEAMRMESLAAWLETPWAGVKLINAYGPTEGTITSTLYEVPRNGKATGLVPIGRPLRGKRVYVLDEGGQCAPMGVVGELYLGGMGLAKGYWGKEEWTRERFIEGEVRGRKVGRLYRTGDMGRYLKDGNLEYVGRRDGQVKLRGYRVEVGEVEAVLGGHPGVKQVAVEARADDGGATGLVAYIGGGATGVSAAQLREYARGKLPGYMVPERFVVKTQLPQTAGGKVDRQALRELGEEGEAAAGENYVAPRDELELKLTEIWEAVLKQRPIGVTQNFFDVGGHSLLATQVVSRIRRNLNVEIPLRTVFELPTIAAMASAVRRASGDSGAEARWKLEARGPDQPPQLSLGQERLWFLQQLEPNSAAQNIAVSVRHQGSLEESLLARCLAEIARRHDTLRSRIVETEGNPSLIVDPPGPIEFQIVDLRSEPEAGRPAKVERSIRAEAEAPFDLRGGRLWRTQLIRTGSDSRVLLVTMHHIISDAWSVGVFFRELQALAEAFAQDRPSPLPELAVQYPDYAIWQRRRLEGGAYAALAAYWTQQLAGAPLVLDLPTDFPRPAMQTYRSRCKAFQVEPDLAKKFKQLGQREGATLFMASLAAFNVLLFRYSGQADILVGTPVANRDQLETERLIGFFINTLVLRTDLSGNPTFRELLARVRAAAMSAYAHQEMPFDKLVELMQPQRDLSRPPLFQVLFSQQNMPQGVETAAMPSVEFNATGASMYELCLEFVERSDGWVGVFDYNADLFEAETIERMAEHFRTLLRSIVANPDCRISALGMVEEAERARLLHEWSGAGAEATPGRVWLEQFERQAERRPEAEAVRCGGERLAYAQLDRQANQLAHELCRQGVSPGTPVLVCLERSVEVVVAMIGIWKAGGIYVPMDSDAPPERQSFLVEDSGAPVVVGHRTTLEGPWAGKLRRVFLDDAQTRGEPAREALGSAGSRPQDTAYVIYTSGSTGTPKGVEVTHEALGGHLEAACVAYGLNEADSVLQFSSLSFDASLEQILGVLSVGGRLVLRGRELWEPGEFARRVAAEGLTVVDLPTAYWHELAREWAGKQSETKDPLRLVIVGGEAMGVESLQAWLQTPWAEVRLLNAYGPTEGTITSTLYEVPRNAAARGRVPIGRPLRGKRAYVLAASGQCAPIGVAGEIYLGGLGLATGYWRREEWTRERFEEREVEGLNVGRLYRTGDLGRYLRDGNLEYLGRRDGQVKVRGYRVELGEVEAVLGGHPRVKHAAVEVREETEGGRALIAYVGVGETSVSASQLREYAQGKLPAYMVPGRIVVRQQLPVSASGKVDRRALRQLRDAAAEGAGADHVAPRDELELQLAEIWESVLKRRPIGVTENFFDAGGHSLMAVRLFSKIEHHLGKRLPLVTLYQDATIERQAAILRTQGWRAPWASLVPIRPGGSRPPFFIVHGVGGNILWCRDLLNRLSPDQPCYGIQAQGLDPDKAAHTRVEEMAAHYLKEVLNFQPSGPYYLGGFCMGGMIAFELGRLLEARGETVGMIALMEAHGPEYFLDPAQEIQYFYEERSLSQRIRMNLGKLRRLNPQQRGELIRSKLAMIRNRAAVVMSEWLTKLLLLLGHRMLAALHRVHQANIEAQRNYRPDTGIQAPLDVFMCEKQPLGDYEFDPLLGWGRWTAAGVNVHTVPGWHSTLLHEPYVTVFAEKLDTALRRAQVNSMEARETA